MSRVRRTAAPGLIALFVGSMMVPIVLPTGPTSVRTQSSLVASPYTGSQPNIVVILTDDQRYDDLSSMPVTDSQIIGKGITFDNSFVSNPWCCPSRSSVLTGEYSHSTDVYRNFTPHGGFGSFKDSSTLATWLHGAGYRTGLVGKYLNQYTSKYVPPGWDRWFAFCCDDSNEGGAYYNYTLVEDGVKHLFGSTPPEYSTDVLGTEAVNFIQSAPSTNPLFLYFTPFAPHGQPIPADRDKGHFSGLQFPRLPNFNEADVSDKPAYIQALPVLSKSKITGVDNSRRAALETLLAVDNDVSQILSALQATGRLSSTLILFASDNGFSRGEHRWTHKVAPYEEDIRVPLVMRYDPITTTARHDPNLVVNIDWAPTIAALAQVPAPAVEGVNLLPLLGPTTPPAPIRNDFLIEHLHGGTTDNVPSYCGVRSANTKYVQYSTGEEELYDLTADPYELQNKVADPAYASMLVDRRTRLHQLCQPPPPGFTFSH